MKSELKKIIWIMPIMLIAFAEFSHGQTNTSPVQTVCIGNEPYLVTPSGGSSYTWTITGGTSGTDWDINGTGNSISVDWKTTGVYTLAVEERNSAGCYGLPREVVVTVISGATVDPVADLAFCNGVNVPAITFTSQVPGTTFSWTNNNTTIGLGAGGTGSLPSFTAINTGTVPVTAVITVTPSTNGCTGTPLTFNIFVNPVPVPAISGSGPAVCQSVSNSTEIYSTADVPGNTYNWSVTGGTFTGQGTNLIVVTWTTPGPGSVSVTETVGNAGCSATDTRVINIQAAPNTGPIMHN